MMSFQVDCSHEAFALIIDSMSSLYGDRVVDEVLMAQIACHVAFIERSWQRSPKPEKEPNETPEAVCSVSDGAP